MFRPFADWLADTPLSKTLQDHSWVVPTSQSIHILAVSIVFGSACMVNLRLLGVGRSGRRISQRLGDAGLLASDLLPELPLVMHVLRQGGL